MTIYFIMYALLFAVAQFTCHSEKGIKKRKSYKALWMIGIVFVVLALRHPTMGGDLGYHSYNGYLKSFTRIAEMSWKSLLNSGGILNYEWGYIIFNKLLSYISVDYQCIIVTCALVSLIPIGIMIRRYSRDFLFSVFVYLGLPSFLILYSGLRQGIAIGICCLAYKYIEEKKPFKFIATVIFASFFHYTAIIFLIAYPVFKIKFSKTSRLISLVLIPIVFVLRVPLFGVLSKILKEDTSIEINNSITLFLAFVCVYIFCAVFVNEEDAITRGFLNIFYLACLCTCFTGIYSTALRVAYYFMTALVIALPNTISKISDKKSYMLSKFFIMFAFIAYGLYSIWSAGASWAVSYPYHFFWETL